jgi:hypothetical protein
MSITKEDLVECMRLAEKEHPNVKIAALTSKGTKINSKGEEYEDQDEDEQPAIMPDHIEMQQILGTKKSFEDKMGYLVFKITNTSPKRISFWNPRIELVNPDNDKKIKTEYVIRRGKHTTYIQNKFKTIADFDNFKFPYEAKDMRPAKRFESERYGLRYIDMLSITKEQKDEYYKQELGTKETIYLGKRLAPNIPIWLAMKSYGSELCKVGGEVPSAKTRRKGRRKQEQEQQQEKEKVTTGIHKNAQKN